MTVLRNILVALLAAAAVVHGASLASAACTKISSTADLAKVRANLKGSFCLTKDLDLSAIANFDPIKFFQGTFEGNGHTIKNLKSAKGGFFSSLTGATVNNLRLANAKVTAGSNQSVGILAGVVHDSTLTKVRTAGTLKAGKSSFAGGLVGNIYDSTITLAIASVNLTSADSSIGGLVGFATNTKISLSYATGDVQVTSGFSDSAGGLVGLLDDVEGGSIADCFATGDVSAKGNFSNSGGLVGMSAFFPNATGKVLRSYSIGKVSGTGSSISVGGLIGKGNKPQVTNSYWDTQTSGQATSAGGIGRTTVQLKAKLPNGFAPTVWSIKPTVTYPYLKSLPSPFPA